MFFGNAGTSVPVAYWDNDQDDYMKFLRVAKDSGVSIMTVNEMALRDSGIDDAKLDGHDYPGQEDIVKVLSSGLESFRQHVGKTSIITISSVYKYVTPSFIQSTS